MKFWDNVRKQPWWNTAIALCVAILFYMLLGNLAVFGTVFSGIWTVVKPLLYGLIIAYLIDPLARFYHVKLFSKSKKQGMVRKVSVAMAILTVILVIVLITVAVVPAFVQSVITLANHISRLIDTLEDSSGDLASILPTDIAGMFSDIHISDNMLAKISDFFSKTLTNFANASLNAGSGFANLLIAFILGIYYLMDKKRLQVLARRVFILMLKEDGYNSFIEFMVKVDKIFLDYIKGTLIEAFIVGVVNWIFMMVVGMPYALLVSIIVGITNIAPTFGPIVGAVLGAFLLLIENPIYALVFLIFTLVLQTVDGYIIKPRLFGGSLGVSPLLILIMIIVGGRIFGVVGILLAIPFSAIASIIANDWWAKYKARKHIHEPEPEEILNPDMAEIMSDEGKEG